LAKMAFALNTYNIMMKYAFMKVGIGNSKDSRDALVEHVKFNVCGEVWSLKDWYNRVLRVNRRVTSLLKRKPFKRTNSGSRRSGNRNQFLRKNPKSCPNAERKQFFAIPDNTIPDQNILIHFGITSRFIRNSPPIPYFTMDYDNEDDDNNDAYVSDSHNKLHKELLMMAFAYCEDDKNVKIKSKERTVRLAGVFNGYRSDFINRDDLNDSGHSKGSNKGNSNHSNDCDEILWVVLRFLRADKKNKLERLLAKTTPIRVLFYTDDETWGMNTSHYESFDVLTIRGDEKNNDNASKDHVLEQSTPSSPKETSDPPPTRRVGGLRRDSFRRETFRRQSLRRERSRGQLGRLQDSGIFRSSRKLALSSGL